MKPIPVSFGLLETTEKEIKRSAFVPIFRWRNFIDCVRG